MSDLRVLTVKSFGETEEENLRVTLNPSTILMLAAVDDTRQGFPVKRTTIVFMNSEPVDVCLSEFDLMTLEKVVGAYSLDDFC